MLGVIYTIRFPNFNRTQIRIIFGFWKSCEYEYEYIWFWKINQIRILFGLKISAEYEYHHSVWTIWIYNISWKKGRDGVGWTRRRGQSTGCPFWLGVKFRIPRSCPCEIHEKCQVWCSPVRTSLSFSLLPYFEWKVQLGRSMTRINGRFVTLLSPPCPPL